MSKKRPAGLEGFDLGDTTPLPRESDRPGYGATDDYYVVPQAAAGPVAETSFIDEPEAPPPSYDDAVRDETVRGYVQVPQDDQGATPVPLAEGESDALSPEEIAIVLKMQDERGSYIPKSPTNRDDEEESQMLNPEADDATNNETSSRLTVHALQPETREPLGSVRSVSMHSIELGETRQERSEEECSRYGPLNVPLTRVSRFLKSLSGPRLNIAVLVLLGLMGLAVFLGVFGSSFVYVEYHEIALKQSKMTGAIDREHVYYDGCYVLGPDTEFVRFPATSQEIDLTISVFTLDTISVTISFSLQYFLRPEEVGQLHHKYAMDYDDVFRILISSSVKNLAGTSLTVDNFRFNRTYVEVQMHNMLRKKLGGDCCPSCCPKHCQSNTYCSECKTTGTCDQGYHTDVRYFSLKKVTIPNSVFERYLKQTILGIQEETEFFIQDSTVIKKETERMTQGIKNGAEEIIQQANAISNKTRAVSEADYEKVVQYSYSTALKGLFSNLSITQEDHKLSLMMIQALDEAKDNLYYGYAYEQNTLFEN